MGKLKIDRLSIGTGSRAALYDRKQSPEELFLEDTDKIDVYRVTLREGTYSHAGDPALEGEFDATLSVGGSFQGHVITQIPGLTKEGEPGSITLTLQAER